MDLALSNLAWKDEDSIKVFKLLKQKQINKIECVFTRIKDWSELTDEDIIGYKNILENNNITPYSAQSIFYGINCELSEIDLIVNHFKKLIQYSKILGLKVLVFGSPSLRKKCSLWQESLVEIFKTVDGLLEETGITVVIEPNAKIYGGEFWHRVSEIVEFIEENQLQNIRTMIDTHNIILEHSDPRIELINNKNYIEHVHISEEKMKNIELNETHLKFAEQLRTIGYDKTITYEVLNNDGVLESLNLFCNIYKD
jgi:sugar phosphate isomerase/epimerase